MFFRYSNTNSSLSAGIGKFPGLSLSGWSRCSSVLKKMLLLDLTWHCQNVVFTFTCLLQTPFPLRLDQIRTRKAILFTGFNDVEVTRCYHYLQNLQCLAVCLFEMQKPQTLQSWDLKASSLKAVFLSSSGLPGFHSRFLTFFQVSVQRLRSVTSDTFNLFFPTNWSQYYRLKGKT